MSHALPPGLLLVTEAPIVLPSGIHSSLSYSACRYVRCLNLPGNAPPQLLAIAPGPGILLAHSRQSLAVHAYTINGRHMASTEGIEQLNAFAVSADGRFLLTGGARGTITLRWIHSLQVYPLCVVGLGSPVYHQASR